MPTVDEIKREVDNTKAELGVLEAKAVTLSNDLESWKYQETSYKNEKIILTKKKQQMMAERSTLREQQRHKTHEIAQAKAEIKHREEFKVSKEVYDELIEFDKVFGFMDSLYEDSLTKVGLTNSDVEDVNKLDKDGHHLLYKLVSANNKDAVALLLKRPELDVNEGKYYETPLLTALRLQNKEMVQLLLSHKNIEVNKSGSQIWSPLSVAAAIPSSEFIELILAKEGILVNEDMGHWRDVLNYKENNNSAVGFRHQNGKVEIANQHLKNEKGGEDITHLFFSLPKQEQLNILECADRKVQNEVLFEILQSLFEGEHIEPRDKIEEQLRVVLKEYNINSLQAESTTHTNIIGFLRGVLKSEHFSIQEHYDFRKAYKLGANYNHYTLKNGVLDEIKNKFHQELRALKILPYSLSLAIPQNDKELNEMFTTHSYLSEAWEKRIQVASEELSVNESYYHGGTPLFIAAGMGNKHVVEVLVKAIEIDLNKAPKIGYTPLDVAVLNGHLAVVEILTIYGANPNIPNIHDGMTSLHLAVMQNSQEMVSLLLDCGADMNFETAQGKTPLVLAQENGFHKIIAIFDVVKIIAAGEDVNQLDQKGESPLYKAVSIGSEEAARLLLEHGADIHYRDKTEMTLLHWAANNGYKEVVELLLEYGLDMNARDKHGHTPLFLAARLHHKEVVKFLIEKHVDINQTWAGNTSLHVAVTNGNKEMVELLVTQGADINLGDFNDFTPLYCAVWRCTYKKSVEPRHKEIVEFLLKNNADVNKARNNGQTPLHLASEKSLKEIIELLFKQSNLDVNIADYNGLTALHLAARSGNIEIVTILLSHGGKINFTSKEGKTPILLAKEKGFNEIVELLENNLVLELAKSDSCEPKAELAANETIVLSQLDEEHPVKVHIKVSEYDDMNTFSHQAITDIICEDGAMQANLLGGLEAEYVQGAL